MPCWEVTGKPATSHGCWWGYRNPKPIPVSAFPVLATLCGRGSSAFGANHHVVVFCKSVSADRALDACVIVHKYKSGPKPFPFLIKISVLFYTHFRKSANNSPIVYSIFTILFYVSKLGRPARLKSVLPLTPQDSESVCQCPQNKLVSQLKYSWLWIFFV